MSDPFQGAAPITTPGLPVYQDRWLSDYTAPGREVLTTQLSNAVTDWPLAQITRTFEMEEAEGTAVRGTGRQGQWGGTYKVQPDSPLLPKADAEAQLKELGLEGQIEIPETGIRQRALGLLADHRKEQNRRNAILARSPGGLALNTAGVLGTLAVSALDPINVATAFIPVVGEARYAKLLASAGESVLARTAVRAGVGAVEGAAGAALIQPLAMAAADAYQDDYRMNDALANIAYGGLFGAALHQLPAALGWVSRRMGRGIPIEHQQAALSEAISAFIEDRQPRVTEMMEGIRRSELMGSTTLSKVEPQIVRQEPEVGAMRAPEEEARAERASTVETRARELDPATFGEYDRLQKERETYNRWIGELSNTRETAAQESVKGLDQDIAKAKEQLDNAPNRRKAKIYQERLDDLTAQREKTLNEARKGDTADMATVRQKLQETDFKMRDIAEKVSAAKRQAEGEVPEPGPNQAANVTPDRDELGAIGTMQAPDTFDRAMAETAPNLMGVLTKIRDERVSLPADDARLLAETTRQTPLYNRPPTPEANEAELTAYATATDDALLTAQQAGRLTDEDLAVLAEADQQIALSEQKGTGWKAAAACIARAFT